MPLAPQSVNINFAQGLNTKTDPWQVPIGQFERLVNSIFQTGGMLQKRNGYGPLSSVTPDSSYLTTLNANLISVGSTISAFSDSLGKFISKGVLQPCNLSVLPLVRNNRTQIQADSSISNGLICTVYSEQVVTVSSTTVDHKFLIADSVNGQNIVPSTEIPVISGGSISGSSRMFTVDSFFVIVSQVLVSSSTFLQYVSIPVNNPVKLDGTANVSIAQKVNSDVYVPTTSNPGWDGVAVDGNLVLAFNTNSPSQEVRVVLLTTAQIATQQASTVTSAFVGSTFIASILSICVDVTVSPNIFYINFWSSTSTDGWTAAVSLPGFGSITQVFTPQAIITSTAIGNLASSAQNDVCTVYSEVLNTVSYSVSPSGSTVLPADFINSVPVTSAGSVGSTQVVVRGLGLASKAFIANGVSYILSAYDSTFQPSYFLLNGSLSTEAAPVCVAKVAYQNGGGYVVRGLPSVSIDQGDLYCIPYRFKDSVEALNTLNNPQQTTAGGIYSQLGINLVKFDVSTTNINAVDIAQNLQLSGGFLGQFDGYAPVEQNFYVWPDLIGTTYTASSAVTPTGTWITGSTSIVLSSATGVSVGMTVVDSSHSGSLATGTIILFISGTTITISIPAVAGGTSDTLSIQGNIAAVPSGGVMGAINYYYQATYEWTDMQGLPHRSTPSIPAPITTSGSGTAGTVNLKVPTLRLTYKVLSPVKIVIYRWSENTQVYNQVTSITSPLMNDTTVDSVTFVDTLPDSSIVGNNILYTTGGVVPDVNGPACNGLITLFDTRVWQVDAEDANQLWVSKQVIEGTPVEMSASFTIYVAPSIGTTQDTGGVTAFAPMDDKLCLFKDNAIYYINGVGPDNLGTTSQGCSLGNYSQPTFVTSVVGCTNQRSIVLIQDGLMFQSNKGIWLLGRDLSTKYIGAPVEAYNTSIVTGAEVIPDSNYVLFTLDTGEMLMYDYFYGQWGVFEGAPAISSCIYQGKHTILTPQGLILQETPGKYLDNGQPVLLGVTTSWINLASLQGYERFYEFMLLSNFLSPHSLLCQVAYDYNTAIQQSTLITPQNYSTPVPSPFGVPTPFGAFPSRSQWRIHAKQQLCQSFQLTISEVYNPQYGNNLAGAGFTMSGINATVGIKKGRRPIPGRLSSGLS